MLACICHAAGSQLPQPASCSSESEPLHISFTVQYSCQVHCCQCPRKQCPALLLIANIHSATAGSISAASRLINEPIPAAADAQPTSRQAEAKMSTTAQFQMEAALQKDAFLVFRALCKLSVRASETATGTDMTAIRGKVSVLNLLMQHENSWTCTDCSKCLNAFANLQSKSTVMSHQHQAAICSSSYRYVINNPPLIDHHIAGLNRRQ